MTELRNIMDAAKYKRVVLGMIFLKDISASFEDHCAKFLARWKKLLRLIALGGDIQAHAETRRARRKLLMQAHAVVRR